MNFQLLEQLAVRLVAAAEQLVVETRRLADSAEKLTRQLDSAIAPESELFYGRLRMSGSVEVSRDG